MNGIGLLEKVKLENAWISRILPGQDVFDAFQKIAKGIGVKRIVIVSAIGSLQEIVMRDLKEGIKLPVNLEKTNKIEMAGPYELLSMEGTVLPSGKDAVVHIHAVLGKPDGRVMGGHLFSASCFTTLEIVFAELKGCRAKRAISKETGLNEMTSATP